MRPAVSGRSSSYYYFALAVRSYSTKFARLGVAGETAFLAEGSMNEEKVQQGDQHIQRTLLIDKKRTNFSGLH